VLALLHKMFNIALADEKGQWGLAGNPAHGVQKFPEEKRERWLNEEELQQVADALENYPEKCASEAQVGDKQRAYIRKEAQRAVNAIRLSMVTGCRSGEALTAKWTDFDLARGVWTKPSHHTKEKKTEHVPLSAQAQALVVLLESLPHDGDYLFPGRPGRKSKGEHLTTLKGQWKKICTIAKLDGVRIHDLRHSFASHLVSSGVSLPVVGKLLGHTQVQTTHRYAHVADDPQREAANKFPQVL
jgi:integrase